MVDKNWFCFVKDCNYFDVESDMHQEITMTSSLTKDGG